MNLLSSTLQKTDAVLQKLGAIRLPSDALELNGLADRAATGAGFALPPEALTPKSSDGFSLARSFHFLRAALTARPGKYIFSDERCFNPEILPAGFGEITQLDILALGTEHNFATAKQTLNALLESVYDKLPDFQVLPRKTALLAPGAVCRFKKRPAASGNHPDGRTRNFLTFGLIGLVRPEILAATGHDPETAQATLISVNVDLLAMDKNRVKTHASLYLKAR